MKHIYTNIPNPLVHISIQLLFLFNTLLGLIDLIFKLFVKIKFRFHILIGLICTIFHGVYWYYNKATDIVTESGCVFGSYLSAIITLKILYKLFSMYRSHIKNKVLSYRSPLGIFSIAYIIIPKKELYYEEETMNKTYQVQLDFEEPVIMCNSLKEVYDLLKTNGHVYENYSQRFRETHTARMETGPVLIKVSTSLEWVSVPSVEFWMRNYMLDEFYCPDKRPYIETLL